jgi:hypothetical protein
MPSGATEFREKVRQNLENAHAKPPFEAPKSGFQSSNGRFEASFNHVRSVEMVV